MPARQGFSDCTHPDSEITIQGEPFKHLLYQFRLAFSGWRSVSIVLGGESYAALASGLQRALTQSGGCPHEHRTDSLSAARSNRTNRWTDDYAALCAHYQMEPTHNNLVADYQLLSVKVTRSSTIEVRRVVYTVPSRLIGERLQVRLYHDHLALYVGQQQAEILPRVYPKPGQNRARSIKYCHVIRSLVTKPQAFRYSQIRDDLLPNNIYRQLWQKADQHFAAREACKWMVCSGLPVNTIWKKH